MSKLALLVVLCLGVSAWAFAASEHNNFELSEVDFSELFATYITHVAPVSLEPTLERYRLFKSNVQKIIDHNRNPNKTFTQTITKFTGFTLKELEGLAIMAPQHCSATNGISAVNNFNDLPIYFDWRQFGVVTKVKDQGNCGSCWTFSTIGSLESNWAIIKGGKSPLLSEQQLLDCAGDFNNFGCDGGLPSQAFEYIKHAGGIEADDTYPYTAKEGKCVFNADRVVASVPYGSGNITEGDEKALLQALFAHGPISVAFEVTSDFVSYSGGVYVGQTCRQDTQHVNHAVLAVGFGYDSKNNLDYWIVKNSWGTGWGEEGYFRIKRGVNMCGLAVCASYPQIRQPRTSAFLG